ncbi:MAG: hypothetical protein M3P11_07680 [Actinomycetota bacterium]|nr:hypothetical protein [Actinomycetota bacterium]
MRDSPRGAQRAVTSTQAGEIKRSVVIAAVIAVIVLAFGGGYLLAHDNGGSGAANSTTTSPTPTNSHSPKPSVSVTTSPSPEPSAQLEDGRYFVYAKKVTGSGDPMKLTFDLAYLLGGQEADDAAAAHGDPPPEDGYYLVNDNPLLRTVPIDPEVTVRYIPTGAVDQATLKAGNIDGWSAAVNGTAMTDYRDGDAGWWIVIQGGEVTSIKQQYFP